MTDKEYQQAKKDLLSKSKNKGLDLWEKVFAQFNIDTDKAKNSGVYVEELGGYITLYFDNEQDQWLIKNICPKDN